MFRFLRLPALVVTACLSGCLDFGSGPSGSCDFISGAGSGCPCNQAVKPDFCPNSGPCTETLLFQGGGRVPAHGVWSEPFTITSAEIGRLDLIVDWTYPNSVIYTNVIRTPCTPDEFFAKTCDGIGYIGYIRQANGPKPLASSSIRNPGPGTYYVYVGTYEERDESVSARVSLRSHGCPYP